MVFPRDKKLRCYSTELRKEATPQETRLWYCYLRAYPVRMNRQRIIGEYIVDFYCAKARLAIELDGSRHFEQRGREYDAERTDYLNALNIKVLRFCNSEVDRCFKKVCTAIDREVKERVLLVSDADAR